MYQILSSSPRLCNRSQVYLIILPRLDSDASACLSAALRHGDVLYFFLTHSSSNISSNGHTTLRIMSSECDSLIMVIIKLLTRGSSRRLRIRRHMTLVDLHATAIWLWSAMGLVAQYDNMMSIISLFNAGHDITVSPIR